ncbi:hypothetical protein DFP73DRAFT_620875 [Morchella snyderi]|nr:hypothetical protein DFP73DRAFT_620875 [Morchella snyderi]
MSPESRIRSLQAKIVTLQKKIERYEDHIVILEDILQLSTEGAWPDQYVPGIDREKPQRDIAALNVKITRAEDDIEKLGNDIAALREGGANKLRSLQRKIDALWAKYNEYEDSLEALETDLGTRSFWSYKTGRSNVEKEKAKCRGKMGDVMSEIDSYEDEMKSIRERASGDIWHSAV